MDMWTEWLMFCSIVGQRVQRAGTTPAINALRLVDMYIRQLKLFHQRFWEKFIGGEFKV